MSIVSPELALVDPALRGAAIAELPDVTPFAFLEHPRDTLVAAAASRAPTAARDPSRLVAAGVYLAVAVARMCAVNAAIFAGVAVVVFLVNLFA